MKFEWLQDRQDPKPPTPIIENLIHEGELVLLTGQPKSAKSTLAAGMAASITTGKKFLGREVRKGIAVYLAAERPESAQRRLIVAGSSEIDTRFGEFKFNLTMEKEVEQFICAVSATPVAPCLIVLDTFARLTVGLREESSKEMGEAVEALTRIRDAFPASAIVVIHHLTKNKEAPSARGSGALLAGVDVELRAFVSKGNGKLSVANANSIEEGQELPFAIEAVPYGEQKEVVVRQRGIEGVRNRADNAISKRNEEQASKKNEWVELITELVCPGGMAKDDLIEKLLTTEFFEGVAKENRKQKVTNYLNRYAPHLKKFVFSQTPVNTRSTRAGV